MIQLLRPYKGYNKARFFEKVVRQEERPVLPGGIPSKEDLSYGASSAATSSSLRRAQNTPSNEVLWPLPFRRLLHLGWAANPLKRPSSAALSSCLMQLVIEQRYQEATLGNDDEKFAIPEAVLRQSSVGGSTISSLVSRLSLIGSSTRRGAEFIR